MQLNVEQVTPAKTGKSIRVKAGADWYGAKKDSGIQAGTTIEAIVEDGDFGKWINSYRVIGNGAAPAPAAPAKQNVAAPVGQAWLPMASNTVAHAISVGLIKQPSEIKQWVEAVKEALA